jgi:hypothetical protein
MFGETHRRLLNLSLKRVRVEVFTFAFLLFPFICPMYGLPECICDDLPFTRLRTFLVPLSVFFLPWFGRIGAYHNHWLCYSR